MALATGSPTEKKKKVMFVQVAIEWTGLESILEE
jgi:hypothetical protein